VSTVPVLALTCGEPAGVGPELALQVANRELPTHIVAIGNRALLAERAAALSLPVRLRDWRVGNQPESGVLDVLDIPLGAPVLAGSVNPKNAAHVLAMLDAAIDGCMRGEFDAMVTAPVHKGVVARIRSAW